VKLPTLYGGGRLLVVAPPAVQVAAEGLQAAGQEQGMKVYLREGVAAGTDVAVALAGTGPPPSASADQGGAPGRAENVRGGGEAAAIQSVPGRLDGLKWPLIGGFAALFVLGALLLARKPVAVTVGVPEGAAPISPAKPAAANPTRQTSPAPASKAA